MRTTLNLDDRLLRAAKTAAIETGRTLTAVIEDALREVMARQKRPTAEPFTWPTLNLGPTLPGVNLDSSAELLDLMEEDDDPV